MKFSELKYKRPNFKRIQKQISLLLSELDNSTTEEKKLLIDKINKIRNKFNTHASLCRIRHSQNTVDEFYEQENSFFDEVDPKFLTLIVEFYKKLIKYKSELEPIYGENIFKILETTQKISSPEVESLREKEAKLMSEYDKLTANAEIIFDGKPYNLSTINTFSESPDRDIRKRSSFAHWEWFNSNKEKIEDIFDSLVKTRHEIAQKLGYENYIQLAYDSLARIDYGQTEVFNFRNSVRESLLPLIKEIDESHRKKIGVEKIKFYDESLLFPDGNTEKIVDLIPKSKIIFSKLSKKLGKMFKKFVKKEVLDLESREAKSLGGYCDYLHNFKIPFIFANFNNTINDVGVFAHECGHAFNVSSSVQDWPELDWPSIEACEIHSISMEFLTWPYMNLFFENPKKYFYSHLVTSLRFLPYCLTIDEFQHVVYENPMMSKEERNLAWKAIEKANMPDEDYDGCEFLESGCRWQEKAHVFVNPFYYIDYGIAQICAYQLWKNNDIEKYIKLCELGGSKSFLNLLNAVELKSPFEQQTVKEVINYAREKFCELD